MIEKIERFNRVIDLISEWVFNITSFLLIGLMLMVPYEVIARYFFNKPTIWSMEMNQFFLCILFSLGGAHVMRIGAHVSVDIIYNRFRVRARAIISLVMFLLLFFYLYFFINKTWTEFLTSYDWQERSGSVFNPYFYPIKFFIPVGAFLLLLQSIVTFIRYIQQAITGEEIVKHESEPHSVEDLKAQGLS